MASMLLEVNCCFRLLQPSVSAPRLCWRPVLRLDRMTAVAVNAFGCGVRLWHGRVLGEFAVGIDLFFHPRNQFCVLLRREPFLIGEILLESVNTVALAPELVHFFRDVS